jgi:FkbM family methyltransferase
VYPERRQRSYTPGVTAPHTLPERVFLAAGRFAARLPRVRGKTRVLLALYKLLRLSGRHVVVNANLRRPTPFEAQLDLHAWLQRVAFLTGGHEEDTVEFLLDLHRRAGSRGYLLDVGANIGLIAIPFAKRIGAQQQPSVIAVEAVPDNVTVLRRNIDRNGLAAAIPVIPYALGATAGAAQIQVEGDLHDGEGTGTANILPEGSTYECVRQEIIVKTVDELSLPEGCAVVKIDTDGYDLKVLQGGAEFLRRNRPVIFGEFSAHCLRWHQQSIEDVAAFAEAHGYEVWQRVIPTWQFRPYDPATAAAFEQDLLLVPSGKATLFQSFT